MANIISSVDGILNVYDDGTIDIVGGTLHIDGTEVLSGSNSAVFTALTVDSPTLVVDAVNNRVGMGTTAPLATLDVRGTTLVNGANDNDGKADFAVNVGGNPSISLHSTQVQIGSTDINYAGRLFYDGSTTLQAWNNNIILTSTGGSSSRDIVFMPSNQGTATERVRIAGGSGNVGIGTASPTSALHITRSMSLTPTYITIEQSGSNAVGGGAGIVFDTSASNAGTSIYVAKIEGIRNAFDNGSNDLKFYTSDANISSGAPTEKMTINSLGDVGIGTTAPVRRLSVYEDSAIVHTLLQTGAGNGLLRLMDANTLNESNAPAIGTYGNDLSLITAGANRIYITNAGDIGIGTSSPTVKLDVRGDVLSYQNGFYVEMSSNGASDRAGMEWQGTGNLGLLSDSVITFLESDATAVKATFDVNNARFRFGDGAGPSARTVEVAGDIELTGRLYGPSTFYIDPAAHNDDTGTVVISGNLQVDGTTTTVNSTTVSINDKNIVLADNAASAAEADGAGITVNGANATFNYSNTSSAWKSNIDLHFDDNISAFFGTGKDLKVFHDGGNSVIRDQGTGSLYLQASHTILQDTNNVINLVANSNGSTDLYYAGTKMFSTNSVGVSIDGASTEERQLTIGQGRTGSGYAYIDFVGDTTYTDFGFRIIRNNTGANAASELIHRGTGPLQISTTDVAPMLLRTSATERMRIAADGKVGIGTDNPNKLLTVSSTDTSLVAVRNVSGSSSSQLLIDANTATREVVLEASGNAGGQSLIFKTDGDENMRIAANGSIGIGTTNPASYAKLDVNGTIRTKFLSWAGGDGDNSSLGKSAQFRYALNNTGSNYINTWMKVATVNLPNTWFSALQIIFRYIKPDSNYGNSTSPEFYYGVVKFVRDDDSVADSDVDSAEIRATTDDVRVYKTATGVYELQARHPAANQTFTVEGDIYTGGGLTDSNIVLETDAVLGTTTGGTEYTNSGIANNTFQYHFPEISATRVGIGTTNPQTDLQIVGTGSIANPTQIKISGSSGTDNDAKIKLTQTPSSNQDDLALLVAGTDTRTDGLTANDAYILATQRINLQAKGNGSEFNTRISLGKSGSNVYSDLTFETALQNNAAVERMRITGTGDIGIGTQTPGAKLDVAIGTGNAAFDRGVIIRAGDGTYTAGHGVMLQFENEDVIQAGIRSIREGSWQSGLQFYTHTADTGNTYDTTFTEKMRITGDGKVGIGTTTPANRLHVEISTTDGIAGSVLNSHSIVDIINRGGGGAGRGLQIGAPTGSVTGPVYLKVNGTSNRFAVLDQSNDENLTILDSGNVGIGTGSPSYPLHVYRVNAHVNIVAETGDDTKHPVIQTKNTSADWDIGLHGGSTWSVRDRGAGFLRRLSIDSSGRVGIGTDSSLGERLVVNGALLVYGSGGGTGAAPGTVYLGPTSSSRYWGLRQTNSSFDFNIDYFNSSWQTALTIDRTQGNVGIGTTTPTAKLDVAGDVRLSGSLRMLSDQELTWANGDASIIEGAHGNNYSLSFRTYDGTSNSTKMHILGNGNVGIGTTGPASKLVVQGDTGLRINASTNAAGAKLSFSDSSAGSFNQVGSIEYYHADGQVWAGSNDGFIFSGNQSTSYFRFDGNIVVNEYDMLLTKAQDGSDWNAINIAHRGSWSANTNDLAGINVTDSNTLTNTVGKFGITYTSSGHGAFIVRGLYSGGYNASGDVLCVGGNGRVGINTTTPVSNLQVYGDLAIGGDSSDAILRFIETTNGWTIRHVAADNRLAMSNVLNGTDHFNITETGNVGIGTTSPASALDVNGTVTATAFSGPLTGNASTATKLATARTIALGGDVSGSASFDGSANITITATVADDSHNHIIGNVDGLQAALDSKASLDHVRSLGTTAFTAGGGANSNTTTATLISEMEADGAFDSYTSFFKTSWSYATNDDLTDAGRFTETAGTSWITWTDNSDDVTRGNITALAIAPNTGGSAGGVYIYNDQGAGYFPGWREVWTSATDGAGSGLDADLLDGQHGSYYQNASNLNAGTIADARISGSYTGMVNLTGSGIVDFAKFLGNAADTSAAPSYSWTGDTNTGIYQPAADQIGFSAGGTGRMTLSTSALTMAVGLNMNNYDITSINSLTFADPGPNEGINWAGGNLWKIYESPNDLTTNSSGNLQFVTGTTRRMTLDTSSNLWIGGNLTIDGFGNDKYISFRDGYDATNVGIRAKAITTANRDGIEILGYNGIDLTINNGSTVAMHINGQGMGEAVGRVGIGTSVPTYALHLDKADTAQTGAMYISASLNGSGKGLVISSATRTINENTVAALEIINRAGGNTLTATVEGKVGIGTTLPSFTTGTGLEIQQNGTATLRLDSTTFATELRGKTDGTEIFQLSAGYLDLGTSNTTRIRITSDGKVGIGLTNPQRPLDVFSDANNYVTIGANTIGVGQFAGIHFGYRENNDLYRKSAIVFERTDLTAVNAQGKIHILNSQAGTSNATLADAKITISESGNVGIGTRSPSSKFEVVGTVGQLFSVTDSLSGTIFSVSDASGIPSIEADDTGQVRLAEFSGNVLIGTGIDDNSNKLQVNGGIMATADITAYASSDERLKTDLKPIDNALEKVNSLTGYTFNWNELAHGKNTNEREAGVIAQDVKKVLPEVTTTRDDGFMAVKYEKLVPLLIEAIKELTAEIEALKKDR